MSADEQTKAAIRSTDYPGGMFLTFFLDDEEYGIEILKIREIIGTMSITRVPRTPAHIRGVINLRGKVIPVMDLRLKFGMEAVEATKETCVIVVQALGTETGIVVDRVSEVTDVPADDIQATPTFGTDIDTDFILGMGKSNDQVRMLLDIDRVLSRDDLSAIQALSKKNNDQNQPSQPTQGVLS